MSFPGIKPAIGQQIDSSGHIRERKPSFSSRERELLHEISRAKLAGDNYTLFKSSGALGILYNNEHMFDKAMNLLEFAVEHSDTMGETGNLHVVLKNYGIALYRIGDYVKARKILKRALSLSLQNSDSEETYLTLLQLAGVDFTLRNYEEAASYMSLYQQIRDSLYNQKLAGQLADLQRKFEERRKLDEKKQDILLQQQKEIDRYRQRLTIIISGSLLLVFTIIGTAYILRRNHLYRIAIESEKYKQEPLRLKTILETEQAERRRLSRDLHDELGSGLSRIILSIELMKSKYTHDEHLAGFLENISESARKLHENMNGLIWFLNSGNETLELLFSNMREFALDFFSQSTIRCHIIFPENIAEIRISMDYYRNIFLSFKEMLNNVMKHAHAGHVQVSAFFSTPYIEILVQDDGIGFETDKLSSHGNGLRNIRERIEAIGGSVHFSSTPGKGTSVRIVIMSNNK